MCAAVAPEMKLLSWYPSICPTLFIKVWKLINFRREARRRLGYRIIPASILFSSLFRGCGGATSAPASHGKSNLIEKWEDRQTNISKRAQRILISSKDEGILYNIYREKTAASSTATHTRFSLNWIIIIRPGLLLLLMEETDWGLHILKKKEKIFLFKSVADQVIKTGGGENK